jgi:aminoacyl tRNA synthase complex-interacting multifunctional protein 1
MQGPEIYTYPSLIRYFDHIQSCPSVRKAAEALPSPLPFIALDLDSAPKLDRKVEPAKKKVPKAVAPEGCAPTPLAETAKAAQLQAEVPAPLPTEGKAQSKKKEKKAGSTVPVDEDKKKAAGGGKAPVMEDSGEPMPSMIDLRVGHVVDSESFLFATGRKATNLKSYLTSNETS